MLAPLSAASAQECTSQRGVRFCSLDPETRVISDPEEDVIRVATEGVSPYARVRIEPPTGAGGLSLGLNPPSAEEFGDRWSLAIEGPEGGVLASLEAFRDGDQTRVSTAAETAFWRIEPFYRGESLGRSHEASTDFSGLGGLFSELSVTGDGEVIYRWTESPFWLDGETPVDEIRLQSGAGSFGELIAGELTTHHDLGRLEEWRLENRAVIACSPAQWVEELATGLDDSVLDVDAWDPGIRARGEVYITGSWQGLNGLIQKNFGGLPQQVYRGGSGDMFLAKLDDCGDWQWVVTGGSSAGSERGVAVAVDGNRNVIVAGMIEGANGGPVFMRESPAPTSEWRSVEASGEKTAFVAKYTRHGSLLWLNRYSNSDIFDVDTDSQNKVLVPLSRPGASVLLKLDGLTGSVAGGKTFTSTGAASAAFQLTGIAVGGEDRICVTGNFSDSICTGSPAECVSAAGGQQSAFLAQLDSSLALNDLYAMTSSSGATRAHAVAATWREEVEGFFGNDETWDCLVAGEFEESFSYEYLGTPVTLTAVDPSDGFMARFSYLTPSASKASSVIHFAGVGAQSARDVSVARNGRGRLWITGTFENLVQASTVESPGVPWTGLMFSAGGEDAFVYGYSDALNLQGSAQLPSPLRIGGSQDDFATGVTALPKSQRVYATGVFDDSAEFVLPGVGYWLGSNQNDQGYITGFLP
ncbi:MAG: hypothetical protein AAF725_06245 [Acidobacteriota bacterium]